MELANPKSKHIAKATQTNASTNAFSKSLLCRSEKKNKKISPASQKLNLSTDKNNLTIKLNNIDIQTIKHGRRKNHYPQHCIKAIAGEVVKLRSVRLINFCGGGQVIAFKSATALILDRYIELCKLLRYPTGFSASMGIVNISGGAKAVRPCK